MHTKYGKYARVNMQEALYTKYKEHTIQASDSALLEIESAGMQRKKLISTQYCMEHCYTAKTGGWEDTAQIIYTVLPARLHDF